jgi:quercetin dioxygenase-like cupin family protein
MLDRGRRCFTPKPQNAPVMKKLTYLCAGLAVIAAIAFLRAQDPVKVDAKHYKVEFENDQVRVLRIRYGPGEKSTMHEHPNSVAVLLTESSVKFTGPDGKSETQVSKAGDVMWTPASTHLPENTGKKAM